MARIRHNSPNNYGNISMCRQITEHKESPFTLYECQHSITNINNGNACGLDEIPAEVWKIIDLHYTYLIIIVFRFRAVVPIRVNRL